MTALLSDVARALVDVEHRGGDVPLTDATHDSRQVSSGTLFCAIHGASADGHDHAPRAVSAGARALIVERWLDLDVPQLKVPSVRAVTGPAAAVVHGRPSEELVVVGTTGTNGKTTVSYLLEGAFAAAGRGTGVIGTVETRIHGTRLPGLRTTPEGPDLQRLLRDMHTRGVDAVAMEVSSHGLDLHRVDGTRFRVAVYTNLSQDHLDWHGSMEAYFTAKARLFTPELSDRGVVFLDGPWADRLVREAGVPLVTLGRQRSADVRLVEEDVRVEGGAGRLVGTLTAAAVAGSPDASGTTLDLRVGTTLPGAFNLANAATAVLAAIVAGVPAEAAAAGVAACPGAPGRLERVEVVDGPTVFVDYAHTPAAITQVVDTVRAVQRDDARLLVVLGCGGDRDTAKRGPMGAAAASADVAVLTSDNPRTEDPEAILAAVVTGAREAVAAGAPADLHVEVDRRRAIALALAEARPTDVVVIAGKGHETTQELGDRTIAFDDREVVRDLLASGGAVTPGSAGATGGAS